MQEDARRDAEEEESWADVVTWWSVMIVITQEISVEKYKGADIKAIAEHSIVSYGHTAQTEQYFICFFRSLKSV